MSAVGPANPKQPVVDSTIIRTDEEMGEINIDNTLFASSDSEPEAEDETQIQLSAGHSVRTTLTDEMKRALPAPDPDTKDVTGDFRGQDVPAEFKKFRSKQTCLLTVTNSIVGPDNKTQTDVTTFGALRSRGKGNEADEEQRKEERKKQFIQVKWSPDTQVPSILICIERPDQSDATFRIFPNSIQRKRTGETDMQVQIGLRNTHEPDRKFVDPQNEELQQLFEQKRLSQVVITLMPSGSSDPLGKQQIRRPLWHNISESEVNDLVERWGRKEQLEPWELAVARLQTSNHLVIHEHVHQEQVELYQRFARHMRTCFKECCMHDFYWFWTKQHNGEITQDPLPWIDAPVPFWMAQHWLAKFDSNNDEVFEPWKWESFARPNVFPLVKTACTAGILGVARAIGTVHRIRDQRLAEEDGKISAFFQLFRGTPAPPGSDDTFKVDIYSSLQAFSLKGISLVPEPDTPIKITFYEAETEAATILKKYEYHGHIVENLWDTPNVTFVARVSGKPFRKFGQEAVSCTVKITGNDESSMRQHKAFSTAAKGLTRDERPDFDHILFDTPPTLSPTSRNAWTEEIKQFSGMKEEFLKEAKDTFTLNEKQMEFTKHFLENKTGISILIGPPGGGKSVNMMAIILLYLSLNKKYRKDSSKLGPAKKILVTAPSNVAVDELLSKCVQKGSEMGLKLIRFRGGKPSTKRTTEDVEMAGTEEAAETLEDAYWNMMEVKLASNNNPSKSVHKDREFIADFVRTIKGWPKTHTSKADARAYLGLLQELVSPSQKTAEERRRINREKDELQEKLFAAYFSEVDGVFTTLSGASNDILKHYKPTCLKIDEAAQANLGEKLTGIVPHIETIENVVLAGDPKQIRGRGVAEGRNEFFKIQNDSLMHKIAFRRDQTQEDHDLEYIQLEVQHRMDPEISGPISDIFYGGKLIDADVVKKVQPVRETAKDYLRQKLGAAYDGSHRFAIDVSGEKNVSRPWKSTTSQHNPVEVETICALIKGMLEHTPPLGGVRVEPKDIVITTDYSGQDAAFKVTLQLKKYTVDGVEKPLGGLGDNKVTVTTTSNTQGSEGNIQFISMVMNDDKKINRVRWIAKPDLLNVKYSRAKHLQIAVGNVKPWQKAIKNEWTGWGISGPRNNKVEFVKMMASFWPDNIPANCKIISQDDFVSGIINGKPPTQKGFPNLIKIVKRPADGTLENTGGKPAQQKKAKKQKKQPPVGGRAPLPPAELDVLNKFRADIEKRPVFDMKAMSEAMSDIEAQNFSEGLRYAMVTACQRVNGKFLAAQAKRPLPTPNFSWSAHMDEEMPLTETAIKPADDEMQLDKPEPGPSNTQTFKVGGNQRVTAEFKQTPGSQPATPNPKRLTNLTTQQPVPHVTPTQASYAATAAAPAAAPAATPAATPAPPATNHPNTRSNSDRGRGRGEQNLRGGRGGRDGRGGRGGPGGGPRARGRGQSS